MTTFKFDKFAGLIPRLPDSLLPPTNASAAQNCEFSYGELRNTKGDFNIQSMLNAPASLYTDTGLTFYSWPIDVDAVRSPLANDTYNRLYYTTPTDIRVTSRAGMAINGGEPASSYRVGVPRPVSAPTFTVPSAPSLTNTTIAAKFHYEYAGVKYQEQAITLTQVTANSKWTFTPPTKSTGAGTSATFAASYYYVAESYSGDMLIAAYWAALPASTTITPITDSAITTSGGATYNTTQIKDASGLIHQVESLFSLLQYALLKVGSSNTAIETPDQAMPVIRMTGTDNANASVLFDIYSANSGLGVSTDLFELSIAKDVSPALTYTLDLIASSNEADKETRAYIYTYVNTYGEEGPPSPAAEITIDGNLNATITALRDVQAIDYAPIKEIRIYRTPTGSEIADYFYVGSITVLTALGTLFQFIDTVKAAGLNEAISSTNNYAPDAALLGLTALPNGILMAWKGNELWFSEAYKPWAWPPQYVKTFTHAIVGGIAHGSGALITTIGQPFFISGVSPDSMTETKVKVAQAGVSKWSLADLGGTIAYASHDGIVTIDGGQASLTQSEQFFTREKWRELYATGFSSMRFAVWDGRLIVYSSTNAFTSFMIRLDEAKGSMTNLPTMVASCTFVSPVSDQCYYTYSNQLYQFSGGTDAVASWASREMVFNAPVNFGWAQAICTGTWSLKFYAEGELRHTQALTGNDAFRLPSGFKSDRWKVSITGSGCFRELRVGETARELKAI